MSNSEDDLELEAGRLHVTLGPKTIAALAGVVSLAVSGGFSAVDTQRTETVAVQVQRLEKDLAALREACAEFYRNGSLKSCEIEAKR